MIQDAVPFSQSKGIVSPAQSYLRARLPVVLSGDPPTRQRLHQPIEKLLSRVEVLDADPLVLAVAARVVHIAEEPTHPVERGYLRDASRDRPSLRSTSGEAPVTPGHISSVIRSIGTKTSGVSGEGGLGVAVPWSVTTTS